jgi:hypothetical protein
MDRLEAFSVSFSVSFPHKLLPRTLTLKLAAALTEMVYIAAAFAFVAVAEAVFNVANDEA